MKAYLIKFYNRTFIVSAHDSDEALEFIKDTFDITTTIVSRIPDLTVNKSVDTVSLLIEL